MSRKVLVTGGAGFIGSHLVDALVAQGDQVRVVDALVPQVHGAGSSEPRFLPKDVPFVKADLCDETLWEDALSGVDAVVHLAAEVGVGQSMYEIVRYVRGNTLATAVLLQALLQRKDQIQKLVVASSMSVYGEGAYACSHCGPVYPKLRPVEQLERRDWEMHCDRCGGVARPVATGEDKPLYPTSIYAITKRDHEEMCLTFGRAYNIPTIALRFFNVYGPRQALSNPYTGVAAIFSARLLNGKPALVFEDGMQTRDFVHVSDIVQAILLALRSDRVENDVFNVGTGRPLTVLDVAKALAEGIGVDLAPEMVHQFRAGDIRHCYADISKIRRTLGFQPEVRFEEGMRELVAWIRQEPAMDRVDLAYRELAERGLTG
jgi:dTDP-L-rhamnose 4-epimerase